MPAASDRADKSEESEDVSPASCIVVCGPTASGKSEIADELAASMSTSAVVVDSMQVYREIPSISNQGRKRFAYLCGITSIEGTEEKWSVARHRDAVLQIADEQSLNPIILDAGTGMYLNAILLDIELAPKSSGLRDGLMSRAASHPNPRRETRRLELEMSGGDGRGSIWEGRPRFDTRIYYLKPRRENLDENIRRRSRKIFAEGLEEAEYIEEAVTAGAYISSSVADSIGVRELRGFIRGEMSEEEAADRISTRTRQLSRRQMTWFDKLAKSAPSLGISCTTFTDYEPNPQNAAQLVRKILHENQP